MIQPRGTFFGLTGPGVVKSVLGEDVTPDELGGPDVHSQSGVTDFVVEDEVSALRKVREILNYIPNNNGELARYQPTSDPVDRKTWDIDILLKKAFNSPTGFNTPFDVSIIIQQICDHGDYFEVQPSRARNTITAFGASVATSSASSPTTAPSPAARSTSTRPSRSPASCASARSTTCR